MGDRSIPSKWLYSRGEANRETSPSTSSSSSGIERRDSVSKRREERTTSSIVDCEPPSTSKEISFSCHLSNGRGRRTRKRGRADGEVGGGQRRETERKETEGCRGMIAGTSEGERNIEIIRFPFAGGSFESTGIVIFANYPLDSSRLI